MALVRLLFELKKTSIPRLILVLGLAGLSAVAHASQRDFENFGQLRSFLLNEIGAAKSRVWVVSDFLSDGETISSLYVAKYRGLNVSVLLGRTKAQAYMSRLDYLKRQNIPSALRPNDFPFSDPTLILVDNQLFRINGELNFLDQQRRFTARVAESSDKEAFQDAFQRAQKNPEAASVPPVPLVGKARHNSSRFSKMTNSQSREQPEGYNYDRQHQNAAIPAGVPRQLPKQTVYQKRGRSGQDVHTHADGPLNTQKRTQRNILNPITARDPVVWSPRSPESF